MAKIQVLHCAETIKGGVATYLRELLPLQVKTFGLDAIAVIIPMTQRAELPCIPGVKILSYNDKKNRILNALSIAKLTIGFLRDNPTKIVHIHSTFAGATLRPLIWTLFRNLKVVYCPHGWAWDRPMVYWKQYLTIGIERALSVFCKRIVCISQHEKKTALAVGINENKLSVVLNGLDNAPTENIPDNITWPKGEKKLLFIGRFDKQKGVDIFCDALRFLDHRASGLLVGDYVLGDSNELTLPSNCLKLGWLSSEKLQSIYASADALIVPSRWEGFGLVATEAMRAGLPVIASNVGGLSEVIEDKVTGVLIPPNDVQSLVDAVNCLDLHSLKKMGASGKNRFDNHFTIERVHNEILELYRSL